MLILKFATINELISTSSAKNVWHLSSLYFIKKNYHRLYSQSGCVFECKMRMGRAKTIGGCTPWFYPSKGNYWLILNGNVTCKSRHQHVWPVADQDIPVCYHGRILWAWLCSLSTRLCQHHLHQFCVSHSTQEVIIIIIIVETLI